ncbi:MAG: glycosyltransferase family 39 protein [Bacteroidia bacterium]|nr:glycosyltransferase family 39 protein [Bacteroidia bacterium]
MKEFILKYKWVLFIIIVSVNFLFKFLFVGDNSLWLDECYSVQLAHKSVGEIITVAMVDEPNPPLYGIAMHYWINMFGDSEVSVRSLSVLASALAAGILFLLCLHFFNWQSAVFASIAYLTSNELYYYAQEARTYALIVLWVILSYYLFLSLINRPTLLKAILFAIVNACIFYSHFLACFIIVGEIILFPLFAFQNKTEINTNGNKVLSLQIRKSLLIYFILSGFILVGLLFPWKDRLVFLLLEGGKAMWLAKPTYADFKNCIYDFYNSKGLYQAHIYSALLFIVLLCIKKFRHEGFNWKMLLFALVAGPGLLYLNYFLAGYTPIFLKRYVLFTTLGFILAYAYLFSLLNFNFYIKLALFLTLSIFSFSKMIIPRESLNDYNKAIPHLKSLQKDNTTLIINDMQDQFAYYYDKEIFRIGAYHLKHQALRKNNVYTPFTQTWPEDEDFSMYHHIYYTRSFFGYYDPQETIPKRLALKYKQAEDISDYKGIKITHYINQDYKPK